MHPAEIRTAEKKRLRLNRGAGRIYLCTEEEPVLLTTYGLSPEEAAGEGRGVTGDVGLVDGDNVLFATL